MRTRWAALVSVAGGFVGAGAFPQVGIWPLAFVSVAALSVAVDGRRSRTGAWLGLLYGLAFFVPLLHWTGIYVGPVPWLILALSQAAFTAALGAVLPLVQRLRPPPLWIAAAWVLEESLRDRMPFGGFPWGRLAFSQSESPLRWFAALGGMPLITFAVALGGGALTVLALRAATMPIGSAAPSWRRLAPPVALLAAVPLLGLSAWPLVRVGDDAQALTLNIALIQGDVPVRGLNMEARAREVLGNHVAQTLALADQIRAGTVPKPDLVLWPENASDVDPFNDPTAYEAIDKAVHAVGVPVLVGAILVAPEGKRWNAGIMWSPTTGPGDQYRKRHPVPFAEYVPLRGIAEAVSNAAKLVTSDMVAGEGDGLVRGGPVPVGDVICYEIAYDGLVRSSVQAGAQLLVVQTNNATFGFTSETYQQLAMSQLRAIETGRTVAQVATTGESAVIDPNGRVRAASGDLFTSAIVTATVAPRTATTVAVELREWPEYVGALAAALAALWSVRTAIGRGTARLGRWLGRSGSSSGRDGTEGLDANPPAEPALPPEMVIE